MCEVGSLSPGVECIGPPFVAGGREEETASVKCIVVFRRSKNTNCLLDSGLYNCKRKHLLSTPTISHLPISYHMPPDYLRLPGSKMEYPHTLIGALPGSTPDIEPVRLSPPSRPDMIILEIIW